MDEQQPQQNQNQPAPVPNPEPAPSPPPKHAGYGKRPWWQWALLYLVVGSIVYFLIYLIFFNGSAGDSGNLY